MRQTRSREWMRALEKPIEMRDGVVMNMNDSKR